MTSREAFKKEFRERLLEIHWQQWTTLGIASRIGYKRNAAIDLEALLLSTLTLGRADKRLLTVAIEWTMKNRQWVNLSRINRIARHYIGINKPLNTALVTPEVFLLFLQYLKPALKPIVEENVSSSARKTASTDNALFTYKEIFQMAHGRGTAVEPNLQHPCLLQLYFRGVFGINARAEIFLYLLLQKQGNSSNIAKEIGFDQKIVYRIIEKWTKAGLVEKTEGRNYQLSNKSKLETIVPYSSLPRYINWINAFPLLVKILAMIDTEPFSKDKYVLSSFFRDILPDARVLARSVDLSFSDDRLHQGVNYFEVFSSEMLDVLGQI